MASEKITRVGWYGSGDYLVIWGGGLWQKIPTPDTLWWQQVISQLAPIDERYIPFSQQAWAMHNDSAHKIHFINRCCTVLRWTLSRVTLYTAGHLHTAVAHCSHSRAPGEQWARLCVFTLQGCLQAARLCRGSPVIMETSAIQSHGKLSIPQLAKFMLTYRRCQCYSHFSHKNAVKSECLPKLPYRCLWWSNR